MIVPAMTIQEIHKEVFEDLTNLRYKFDEYRKDFRQTVLRNSRYPLTKSYYYKTREKNNLFYIDFTALKRSAWKNPIMSLHCIYSRPEGKYAVALSVDMNMITVYPPHFFNRYQERILKDASITNEEIIRHYFKNDWGYTGAVVDEDYKSVYHCFENDDKNDKISFVAATSQGYCFGEKQANVNIIKTIISEDMLFENQKSIFNDLKKAFRDENKERYGSST